MGPNPPKKPQNPQKTLMETLRLCNFCNFGATLVEFGTVFTNIILHGIRNFGKNRITLTPQKCPKNPPKNFEYELNHYIFFLFFRTGFAESRWIKGADKNTLEK